MVYVHFLVPPEVISGLTNLHLRHKDGHHGYFADVWLSEFWGIVRSLVDSGYRVDIKPGAVFRLMARKEV